jgi:hypothetical protein
MGLRGCPGTRFLLDRVRDPGHPARQCGSRDHPACGGGCHCHGSHHAPRRLLFPAGHLCLVHAGAADPEGLAYRWRGTPHAGGTVCDHRALFVADQRRPRAGPGADAGSAPAERRAHPGPQEGEQGGHRGARTRRAGQCLQGASLRRGQSRPSSTAACSRIAGSLAHASAVARRCQAGGATYRVMHRQPGRPGGCDAGAVAAGQRRREAADRQVRNRWPRCERTRPPCG